ncbi:hypothetical protein JOB18_005106 [Solea senegalensis]|uniref:Uncharacterized protein n=1 Tax=Solea senegalensis TaxID=28829 RepID=A0AAV6PLR4_SOLSE|nr:hypothetical protein JOB18_005106 [Solea senegalensis]
MRGLSWRSTSVEKSAVQTAGTSTLVTSCSTKHQRGTHPTTASLSLVVTTQMPLTYKPPMYLAVGPAH